MLDAGRRTDHHQCPDAERQEQDDRGDQPRIVAPQHDRADDMDDGVDEGEVDGNETEPDADETRQVDRHEIDAPNQRQVDHHHRGRGQRISAAGDMLVDERPEPVAVMLLDLMDHVDRQLEVDEEERQVEDADEERNDRQQEESRDQAGIHPVPEEPKARHADLFYSPINAPSLRSMSIGVGTGGAVDAV